MNGQLVKVDFHGDQLDCVEQDGKVWVSVRRVCDSLGIAHQRQLHKLKGKPWACVTIMVTHDSGGREQEISMLDLDSLPMWLATIEPSRVAEAVRPKLVDYQKECARVLRDHFLKPRGELVPVAVARSICEEIIKPIVAVIQEQGRRIDQLFEIVQASTANSESGSVGATWTVEQRLYEMRWDGTTGRQRAKIREVANEILVSVFGEKPEKLFGRNFYSRHQLDALDRAIGVVRRKSELAERRRAEPSLLDGLE
jgi:hypothetical protein